MIIFKLIIVLYLEIIRLENAARAYGLSDSELFQTIDLFEKHNIPQVTQCIFALGRNVSDSFVEIVMCNLHDLFFLFRHRKKNLMDQH